MPSGRLASPPAGRRRPPEANRTDITDFTKEKEKRSKKERENVLRRRCSKPGRGGLVRPLKPGTLLTQVGPVYSPMWVPFTRRLPIDHLTRRTTRPQTPVNRRLPKSRTELVVDLPLSLPSISDSQNATKAIQNRSCFRSRGAGDLVALVGGLRARRQERGGTGRHGERTRIAPTSEMDAR